MNSIEVPQPSSENELFVNVEATSIKNIDKMMTGGKSYASYKDVPLVVALTAWGL